MEIIIYKKKKKACVTLQKLYKGDNCIKWIKLQALRGEFKSLCMNDSKLISDYFDQAQTIVNQMWLMVKSLMINE